MTKYLIIGDVHGCLDELTTMLYYYGKGREIISVGDLVDKGPKSHRVVEYFMLHGQCVLGNHEELHIRYHRHEKRREEQGVTNPMKRRPDEFKKTYSKLRYRSNLPIFAWLDTLPPYIELYEHDVVVIHGGVLPGYSYKTMDPKLLCRVRDVKDDGTMARLGHIKDPNTRTLHWPETRTDKGPLIVYGHDPFPEVRYVNNTLCLDTGCVYGNKLSGLLLPERDIVTVQANKVYQSQSSRHDWVNK